MAKMAARRLAILLPVTLRNVSPSIQQQQQEPAGIAAASPAAGAAVGCLRGSLRRLRHSLGEAPDVFVFVGVDEDEAQRQIIQDIVGDCLRGLNHVVVVFPQRELDQRRRADSVDHAAASSRSKAPICYMWDVLAKAAVAKGCNLAVLLGDDTDVRPVGWPALVQQRFARDPWLSVLALLDTRDPGFPSFPVVDVGRHLDLFQYMFPKCFLSGCINQGGDPYLFELYRRCGAATTCADVEVVNRVGGMRLGGRLDADFVPARYEPQAVPQPQLIAALETAALVVREALPPGRQVITIDVAIPCYRLDLDVLQYIIEALGMGDGSSSDSSSSSSSSSSGSGAVKRRSCSSHAAADLKLVLVVDNPECAAEAQEWLQRLKSRLLHRVRIRYHPANLGASAARNTAMDESLAEYIWFLDDDVEPKPGCADAYADAILKHPQASGFAGPTILPHLPQLFPCAAHMSDISFFWGAPAWWRVTVPWAVTANMVLKNSAACHRFGLQFPKTGGGEDIDMCLRAAPEGLLSVPAAMVVHPWWGGGSQHLFLRFALWSWGDSLLTDHFPSVGYRVCPSATELCACLLLLQLLVLLAAAASTTASLCRLPLPLVPAEIAALKMIVAIKLTDIILDVARNILLPQRRHRVVADGCPWWLLLPAAAESCIIKTFSEAGRLLRHISRGRLLNIGVRFDWFCGSDPDIPPREQAKAAVRLGLYLMAAVLACADVGTIKIACSQLGLPISAAAAAFTTALVSLLRMFCEVEGK